MKQMNEETLVNVAGGDYFDHEEELKTGKPLYQIGEQVEVYNTGWHITTTRGIVIDIRQLPEGIFEYLVDRDGIRSWFLAADIESKK
ncbi:MAG: hypothetical protein Q4C49_09745 [Bacillota bacterium]|nr:hypothetical protein [Bacillota bacterium]